ncbi:MAG TPA: pantetheine-phosphate adenylyltransferase [Rhodoferax sp.]|jgi:pantetheine-phosphate adenylyltransferase|nr:pantetheine-phosphate adenylyltransferase [Rhodoferax sp.]HPW83460.1 pantetheine-phosphate adenylyltransferase [Rhodoferax sp.]HQC84313.1 pantetheine-phosphate adenylyltransferase [Rhodoferax sp.]HQY75259.1 pantetheine-phosphate adenylyltransferase [Rhodoferax sp.]
MSNPTIAVFPGTFDPITLGHQDLIRRSASLFGTVIVAVAVAHHKKTMFTLDERLAMVREVFRALPNVQVESFTGLVRDFAVNHGAQVMVRGVRSVTDFDYEAQLAGMNRALAPDVDTVFLTPDARYQYISSTLVREIATLKGDVAQFVAPGVHAQLMVKLRS